MTLIKLRLCFRCKRPNYYDTDEKHYDSISGELNDLSTYCTFCKHPLYSNGIDINELENKK